MPSPNIRDEESLREDQKKFRKYRKLLRQIEHLQLLNRPLNDEEKLKVSRRAYYREQLDKLNAYYTNNQLAYRESLEMNTTGESADHIDESQNTEGVYRNDDEEEENEEDTNQYEEEDEQNEVQEQKNDAGDSDLDEICEKMEKLTPEEQKPAVVVKAPEPVKLKEVKVEEPKKQPKPKSVKLRTFYNTVDVDDAHEDLIVCLDVCIENNLVVTGSRDTTIKAWKVDQSSQQGYKLIQSFGGHSSPITCVKFWPFKYYEQSFLNTIKQRDEAKEADDDHEEIDDRDYEEAQLKLKQLEEKGLNEQRLPFIISSSLDCSARIWCLKSAMCLKELYLYNPVNRFDIFETTIAFGLDAGKIDFWKNLRRAATIKAFDDSESICDVKMITAKASKKIYSLSRNGMIKVFSVNDHSADSNLKVTYEQLHHSDVMDSMTSHTGSTTLSKRTFKCFELLSETKLVLIVNNQSFIVLYDLNSETSKPISTNISSYGLTTCFNKVENQLFVNAYDIDHAKSSINVFTVNTALEKNASDLQHMCTLQDDQDVDSSYCMTELKAQVKKNIDDNETETVVVSCSSRSFKVWHIETKLEKGKDKSVPKGLKEAKMSQLCSRISYVSSETSGNESEEDEEEDSEQSESEAPSQEPSEQDETKKSRCLIQ